MFSKFRIKSFLLLILSVFFICAGINHFLMPDFYLRMMPRYLPWHEALVAISGLIEIVLGVGVLLARFRKLSGILLILLLIAIFPANIQMALHPETFPELSSLNLWLRLPFQLVFIAWVYWVTDIQKTTVQSK